VTRRAAVLAALVLLASCRGKQAPAKPRAEPPRAADVFLRAFEADQAGKPRDGERLYREAIAAHARGPADSDTAFRARFNLGTLLMRERKYDDAREELKQATLLRPTDSVAFYNLGLCEAAAARDKDAVFPLMQAVSLDATHAGARFNLGFVLWRLGRPEQARMHLEIAASQQPSLKPSVDRLLGRAKPPPAVPPARR